MYYFKVPNLLFELLLNIRQEVAEPASNLRYSFLNPKKYLRRFERRKEKVPKFAPNFQIRV